MSENVRPGTVVDVVAETDAVPALQAACCCLLLQALTGSCCLLLQALTGSYWLLFVRQLCSVVASSLVSAHLVACDADEASLQRQSEIPKVSQLRPAAAAAGRAAHLHLS